VIKKDHHVSNSSTTERVYDAVEIENLTEKIITNMDGIIHKMILESKQRFDTKIVTTANL